MLFHLDSSAPLHLQIYRRLRESILHGRLAPGSRLPSSRRQAGLLGVSRNVVVAAHEQLLAEGYVETRRGAGTYVSDRLPEDSLVGRVGPVDGETAAPAERPEISQYARRALAHWPGIEAAEQGTKPEIDFLYGSARPQQRSLLQWQACLRRATARISLDYASPEGDSRLRRALAEYLFRRRGVRCDAEQIVVVSGSQQGLSLAARVAFSPGDRLVIEEPHYLGARRAFASEGLELEPCPTDGNGLEVDRLGESAFAAARGIYITPSHQFPSGATLPLDRRLKILEWAERRSALVIEDDYDSEYRYQGRPVEAIGSLDRGGRVIYVGTFSKVLFPALRLGMLVLPPGLVPAVRCAKWLADRHCPSLEQAALAELLSSGEFDRHLRRMRRRHSSRREALLSAVERHLGARARVEGSNAGIHVVMWLPELPSEQLPELLRRAHEAGVGVYSIAPYYLEPPAIAGLLLGYANLEEAEIEEGIRRLSGVLEAM